MKMIQYKYNPSESPCFREDKAPFMVIADSDFLFGGYQMEIPYGYCKCGCGGKVSIATATNRARNKIKGHPVSYIVGHNTRLRVASKHPLWKGGIRKDVDGYTIVYSPNHPAAQRNYVLLHRLIAERVLGRFLSNKNIVHHSDEDQNNNEPSNLVVCEDIGYHLTLHRRKRAYEACGYANWRKCSICQAYDDPQNLYVPPKANTAYHRNCYNKRKKQGGE